MYRPPFPYPSTPRGIDSRGAYLLRQPAIMYVPKIVDIPPHEILIRGKISIWFSIYCGVVYINCHDSSILKGRFGVQDFWSYDKSVISDYEYFRSTIEENVPATGVYIDIRTSKQLLHGCCPHRLGEPGSETTKALWR